MTGVNRRIQIGERGATFYEAVFSLSNVLGLFEISTFCKINVFFVEVLGKHKEIGGK